MNLNELKSSNDSLSQLIEKSANDKANENKRFKTSLMMTLIYLLSAVIFGILIIYFKGKKSGLEFYAGYLVEQSLSIDNLFVFIMLFKYFQVPIEYQDRVLTWGIIGAVLMRGIMIIIGVAVINKFHYIILIFASILFISAIKLFFESDEPEDLSENLVMKLSKSLVGAVDEV